MKRILLVVLVSTVSLFTFLGCKDDGGKTTILPISAAADRVPVVLVDVPAGSFKTGTDDSGIATVANAFMIGETEVTYELWCTVYNWASQAERWDTAYFFQWVGQFGYGVFEDKQNPVTVVYWRDAIAWCNALTEWHNSVYGTTYDCVYYSDADYTHPIRDSRFGSYGSSINATDGGIDKPYIKAAASGNFDMANCTATGFRLPTANEWELAARYKGSDNSNGAYEYPVASGDWWTPGDYASGATADYTDGTATGLVAWYDSNSGTKTHPVKENTPNALGIYGMSGNAMEWCFDWYDATRRIIKGGSWLSPVSYMQVGHMNYHNPYYATNQYGFRVAKNQ